MFKNLFLELGCPSLVGVSDKGGVDDNIRPCQYLQMNSMFIARFCASIKNCIILCVDLGLGKDPGLLSRNYGQKMHCRANFFYQCHPSIWVEFCEAGVGHWITLRILWNHQRRPCFKLTFVVILIPQSHQDKTCLHLFFFCYAFSTCLLPLLWLENKIYHCASFNYVSPCFVMCSITDFW